MEKFQFLTVSALALAAAGFGETSLAQDAGSAAESATTRDSIVVVARKREESLQDVPISITAIGDQEIDLLGANDFTDIGLRSPNVVIDQNAGTGLTTLSIRGLSGAASVVGVYVDEFLINTGQGANTPLVGVEQVEVLRGPQGTLYGRNTISGLVNTIRTKPGNDLEIEAEFTAGNFGRFSGQGLVSGPIIKDVLQAKVTYYRQERDGFETNRLNGEDVNSEVAEAISAQLRFTPTEKLEVNVWYDIFEREGEGFGFEAARPITNGLPQQLTSFGVPTPSYFEAVDMNGEDRIISVDPDRPNTTESDIWSIRGRIDYDFGPFTFSSLTQFGENDIFSDRDNDFTGENLFSRTRFEFDQEQFTQEIRFTSNGDKTFDWLIGAFYLSEKTSDRAFETIFADFPVTLFPTGAPPPTPPVIVVTSGDIIADFAGPGLLGLPDVITPEQLATVDNNLLTNFTEADLDSYAVFGSATWSPIDSVDITVGLRWSNEEQEATQNKTSFLLAQDGSEIIELGALPFIAAVDPRLLAETFEGDRSDDAFTPSASILWKATDNVNLFFGFARGFNSGGFNLSLNAAFEDNRTFGSENVTSYDWGVRSNWFDGRLVANATGYLLFYNDIQRFVDIATGIGATTNAAEAKGRGFEAELSLQASEHLNLFGSFGYQRTTFTEFNSNLIDPDLGVDFEGNSLAFAPEWTAAFGFQYDRPVGGLGNLFLGSTAQFRDETFFNDNNLPDEISPSAWVLNANAGWRSSDDRIEVSARGINLTDSTYFTNASPSFETGTFFVGLNDPRQWFVQLKVRY